MKNKLILIFFAIFLMSIVSAECSDKVVLNQNYTLTISGFNANNSQLSGATCTISIKYPTSLGGGLIVVNDNTNLVSNQITYLLNGNETNVSGDYPYSLYCSNSDGSGSVDSCYKVSTTGDSISGSQITIYSVLLVISLITFLLLLYGSIKLKWENPRNEEDEITSINYKKYTKVFCIVFSYIIFMWISWLGWNLSYGYLSFNLMSSFFQFIFVLMSRMIWPFIVIIFVVGVIRYVNDMKLLEMIERGINPK